MFLADYFKKLVQSSPLFEVTHDVVLGLVCFRFKNDPQNETTKSLLQLIQVNKKKKASTIQTLMQGPTNQNKRSEIVLFSIGNIIEIIKH